jgi:hypothetical protein
VAVLLLLRPYQSATIVLGVELTQNGPKLDRNPSATLARLTRMIMNSDTLQLVNLGLTIAIAVTTVWIAFAANQISKRQQKDGLPATETRMV